MDADTTLTTLTLLTCDHVRFTIPGSIARMSGFFRTLLECNNQNTTANAKDDDEDVVELFSIEVSGKFSMRKRALSFVFALGFWLPAFCRHKQCTM
jgi:hypothetical protein